MICSNIKSYNKLAIFLCLFRFIRRRKKCALILLCRRRSRGNTQCKLGDFVCSEDKWVMQARRAGHLPVISLISEWATLPYWDWCDCTAPVLNFQEQKTQPGITDQMSFVANYRSMYSEPQIVGTCTTNLLSFNETRRVHTSVLLSYVIAMFRTYRDYCPQVYSLD